MAEQEISSFDELSRISGAPEVKALYERHLLGDENDAVQLKIEELITKEGRYPSRREVLQTLSTWERPTQLHIEQLSPALIFFDGLSDESRIEWVMKNAGDPWLYRGDGEKDMFIVGGDLPMYVPVKSAPIEERGARALYNRFVRRAESLTVINPIDNGWQSKLRRIVESDTATSILASYLIYLAQSRLPEDSGLRKVVEICGAIIKSRVQLYRLFISPALVNTIPAELIQLTRPMFQKTKHINLRNAIAAIKLADAAMLLGDEMKEGPLVALYGNGHAGLEDVWKQPGKRFNIVKQALLEVYNDAKEIADRQGIQLSAEHVIFLLSSFSEILGSTTIWRVRKEPEERTAAEVARNITRETTFLSPTVSIIALAAAQEVFPDQFEKIRDILSKRLQQPEK